MPRFARAVRPFGSRAFVSRLGAAFDVEIGKGISREAAEVAMCVYRRNVRNAHLSLFSPAKWRQFWRVEMRTVGFCAALAAVSYYQPLAAQATIQFDAATIRLDKRDRLKQVKQGQTEVSQISGESLARLST